MIDLADAFIALPGGLGTIEEITEAVSWLHLGLHTKPCGLLNVNGFFDDLVNFYNLSAKKGFIRSKQNTLLSNESDINVLLATMGI